MLPRPTALLAAALTLALPAATAAAQDEDPKRWRIARVAKTPVAYNQGLTTDPGRGLVFSGTFQLFRTGPDLRETARAEPAIPGEVGNAEGYNHIGDVSFHRAEGGRVLLPLECYTLGAKPHPNTCRTGSIGVADPLTLQWRYHVKLDPADIQKAMWVEASPDGTLLWTQAGKHLLAYDAADVNPQNATAITPEGKPAGPVIKPVRRLRNAAPDPLTGATFLNGRLYGAVDTNPFVQMWSWDLRTGKRRLEFTKFVDGESEGLTTAKVGGGTIQWTILPVTISIRPPTYGANRGAMLSLKRR